MDHRLTRSRAQLKDVKIASKDVELLALLAVKYMTSTRPLRSMLLQEGVKTTLYLIQKMNTPQGASKPRDGLGSVYGDTRSRSDEIIGVVCFSICPGHEHRVLFSSQGCAWVWSNRGFVLGARPLRKLVEPDP